jgi:hypothetical protein
MMAAASSGPPARCTSSPSSAGTRAACRLRAERRDRVEFENGLIFTVDEVLPSVDGGTAYVVLDCEQHRRVFVNPPGEQVRIQKKDRLTSPALPRGRTNHCAVLRGR